MNEMIQLENQYCASNYDPLSVVLTKGQGIHVWDDAGNQYVDMMSAYSAVSHGHCHPRLVTVLRQQAEQLVVPSRAFYSDKLGRFLQKACQLTRQDKALPMNTGAEAAETALKAARKWGYTVKGIPAGQAEIICCEGNFHGRTIAMISMSSDAQYKFGFDPFPAGFKTIPYNNAQALEAAITPNTAAFIVEPIQGERGIIVPSPGYLRACADICRKHNVLLIVDEIQTGLGRTGKLLACDHEQVKPDGLLLGKALGGGLLPVSLFLSKKEVMDVFTPGDHGSTFGGNALAATVGLEALNILIEEKLAENSATLGDIMLQRLRAMKNPMIKDIRGKGLFIGLEIDSNQVSAHDICVDLLKVGVLSKETHVTVIRLAPPLIITREQLTEVLDKIEHVLARYA